MEKLPLKWVSRTVGFAARKIYRMRVCVHADHAAAPTASVPSVSGVNRTEVEESTGRERGQRGVITNIVQLQVFLAAVQISKPLLKLSELLTFLTRSMDEFHRPLLE